MGKGKLLKRFTYTKEYNYEVHCIGKSGRIFTINCYNKKALDRIKINKRLAISNIIRIPIYRIVLKLGDVTSYRSASSIKELKKIKQEAENYVIPKVHYEKKEYIPPVPKNVKPEDPSINFYRKILQIDYEINGRSITKEVQDEREVKKLKGARIINIADLSNVNDTDYWQVSGHYLKLFDCMGKQKKFYNSEKELVWETQVVKFYLLPKAKAVDIERVKENALVEFAQIKKAKMRDKYKIMAVFPKLFFRDRRVVFDFPKFVFEEVSVIEVSRYWNIGFAEAMYFVGQIPVIKSAEINLVKRAEKAKRKESQITEKILGADAKVIPNNIQYDAQVIRARSKHERAQSLRNRGKGKIERRIDAKFRKKRNERMISFALAVSKVSKN